MHDPFDAEGDALHGSSGPTGRRSVALLAALASLVGIATYGASSAAAGSYTDCGYESRWGYDRKSGCDIIVFSLWDRRWRRAAARGVRRSRAPSDR